MSEINITEVSDGYLLHVVNDEEKFRQLCERCPLRSEAPQSSPENTPHCTGFGGIIVRFVGGIIMRVPLAIRQAIVSGFDSVEDLKNQAECSDYINNR